MTKRPFASIIIPTYNQADYLREALDSLLAQTDEDWEAVVVNDGSTDHTKEIAESYAAKDYRIRCFHQQNGGVAEALNTGLRNAQGEWVHWLSSDDLFESSKLATNRTWIERHPDTNFFFSYFTLLRQSTGERERRELWGPLPQPEHQILTLFYRNYISGISICVRRSAWEAVGHFDVGLRYAQDYDQWLRLLQQNKACFIPEWTVISRNHAAQGSETFPDACYFDTAKAAIRFLNQHSFAELVPWVDLDDPTQAEAAVREALDVVCDRSSFIYCMGVHPGLIMRLLEWIFSDGMRHPALVRLVRARFSDMSFVGGKDDWAWIWRQIAIALRAETPRFSYDSIDSTALATREWRSMSIEANEKHETMRAYLTRFDKIDPQDLLPEALDRSRIAFLLREGEGDVDAVTTAAGRLQNYGLRPVVLVENLQSTVPTLHWSQGIAVISVEAFDRETLPWLGEVELAVTHFPKAPIWLGALAHKTIAPTATADEVESFILKTLRPGSHRRPVVFLERVLWGGGAERVVYDIARHLDRKLYAPMVFTMFDEHIDGPTWPSHVVLKRLTKATQISAPIESSAPTHGSQFNRLPLSFGRRIYKSFVPLRLREKLKLGARLVSTPQNAKDYVRLVIKRQVGFSVTVVHRLYHACIPLRWRQKVKLGPRLVSTVGKFSSHPRRSKNSLSQPLSVHLTGGETREQAAEIDIIDFDFVAAMYHYNPLAVAFARALTPLESPPIVISAMEEAATVAHLAQTTVPSAHIATLHSLESECLSDIFPSPPRYRAEKHLLTTACNNASSVTMPSKGCCADLVKNFNVSPAKLRRISNPIDCARIAHLAGQRQEPVQRWLSENAGFKMVFVGRLDPQKDPELLLEACSLLKQKGKTFSLAIVGDGWYKSKVKKRIAALQLQKQVVLAGAQANPFPWIAAANALVLSSRFEAFALVLAEAMACGTPAVSVNCPTGPAEVLADGAYGLLTEHNAVALAEGLERLMEDDTLRQSLRKRGLERAEVFDIKNVMPEWDDLIQTVSTTA